MVCKECKLDRVKSPVTQGKHVRFADEHGRIWNGKICPDCYKLYNKERMRRTRKPVLAQNPQET